MNKMMILLPQRIQILRSLRNTAYRKVNGHAKAVWLICGGLLLIGGICILLKKPWEKKFRMRDHKTAVIIILTAILLGLFYASRIIFPDIGVYTGEFIDVHRKGSGLQINEYRFWNGEGTKQVFSMDAFSKKEIYLPEFVEEKTYTIYFDSLTRIIVGIVPAE